MRGMLSRVRVDRAVTVVAAAAVLVALFQVSRQDAALPADPAELLVFLIAIAIGQAFPVELSGGRETAPIAMASALALAMVPAGQRFGASPAMVVLVTAAGMGAGLAARRVAGAQVRLDATAVRLVCVGVAALLFGQPRLIDELVGQLAPPPAPQSWAVTGTALTMIAISLVALTIEALLFALIRSSRLRTPLRVTVRDEIKAAGGLSAAMSATGTLIAMAESSLEAFAVPLFLVPLVMTQFAVRRQAAIRRTYGQTIRSLSRLTELGGYTGDGHADRVAVLAVAVGSALGLSESELRDLEFAALLHDIGQVALRVPIPGGATVLAAPADQRRIASDGADIVRQAGVLDTVAKIIEAQPTPYRQVREFGEELPMASRIIKVVNAYEDLVTGSREPDRRERAIERIHLGLGYEYDPRVVAALEVIIRRADRTEQVAPPGREEPSGLVQDPAASATVSPRAISPIQGLRLPEGTRGSIGRQVP
ncbi:MAG TPA: HD domain-containing phosphohydrolase [Dermatophilaceae bacterium]|nr:HD domain-containing phosphohydrolase [Dermatophilaceae bacterium]